MLKNKAVDIAAPPAASSGSRFKLASCSADAEDISAVRSYPAYLALSLARVGEAEKAKQPVPGFNWCSAPVGILGVAAKQA